MKKDICLNLSPQYVGGSELNATFTGQHYITWDSKVGVATDCGCDDLTTPPWEVYPPSPPPGSPAPWDPLPLLPSYLGCPLLPGGGVELPPSLIALLLPHPVPQALFGSLGNPFPYCSPPSPQAVLGSLGGVELLFPILEQVALPVTKREVGDDAGDQAPSATPTATSRWFGGKCELKLKQSLAL